MYLNHGQRKREPLPEKLKKLQERANRLARRLAKGPSEYYCHSDVGTLYDQAGIEAFRRYFYSLARSNFNKAEEHYKKDYIK